VIFGGDTCKISPGFLIVLFYKPELFHFFPIPQFFGADRDFAQSILVCDVGLKIAAVGTDVIHAFNFLEVQSDLSQFVGLEIHMG
jgi:hypothetical protein